MHRSCGRSRRLVRAEAGRPPAVAGRLELGDDEQALIRKRHMTGSEAVLLLVGGFYLRNAAARLSHSGRARPRCRTMPTRSVVDRRAAAYLA